MILEIFKSDGYLAVNRLAIKKLGGINALVFCEIVNRYFQAIEKNRVDENGYFVTKNEYLEESTGLSEYMTKKSVSELISLGLISKKLKGVPAQNNYKIHTEFLEEFFKKDDENKEIVTELDERPSPNQFSDPHQSSSATFAELEERPSPNYIENNVSNNVSNNKKNNIKKELDLIIQAEPDELHEVLYAFVDMRKLIKKPLTANALKLNIKQAKKLADDDISLTIAIFEQSVMRGYQGVFPLSAEAQKQVATNKQEDKKLGVWL